MSCVMWCQSRKDQRALCAQLRMYANPRRSPITGKMTQPRPLLFYDTDTVVHTVGSEHRHHRVSDTGRAIAGACGRCSRKKCYSTAVPMAWYLKTGVGTTRSCNVATPIASPCTRFTAVRPLFGHQLPVFDTVLNTLRRRRTAVLALHTGFGKCFAENTPFLLSDGTQKMVQHLEVGDELVGATDGTARSIVGTCSGIANLYTVHQERGMDYTVNTGHILSLVVWPRNCFIAENGMSDDATTWNHHGVRWFDSDMEEHSLDVESRMEAEACQRSVSLEGSDRYVEVEIERYLALPGYIRKRLWAYSSAGPPCYPRETGIQSVMRRTLPIAMAMEISEKGTVLGGRPRMAHVRAVVRACRVTGKSVSACMEGVYVDMDLGERGLAESFDVQRLSEPGAYYGFQVSAACADTSSEGGARVLLADHTVVHNTTLACSLLPRIGYRTAVILPRGILFEQWKQTLEATLSPPPRIQMLRKGKDEVDKDADVILMSPGIASRKSVEDFADIGFLMCDEAHMLCSPSYSKLFFRFRPRVLLCLTATPERPDGMERVLHAVAGPEKYFIRRDMHIPHRVWRLKTGYAPSDPDALLNEQGKLDWNLVLRWQCLNPARNGDIAELCDLLVSEGRTVLVLCKRVLQVHDILSRLRARGEEYVADSFTGSAKTFDVDCRVLVSSYSKSGVGFDLPSLDTLVVASDVEAMIQQYHGRIFRRVGIDALVVDLLDELAPMRRHCRTRLQYYEKAGGARVDVGLREAIYGLRRSGIYARCFALCPRTGCLRKTPGAVLCAVHRSELNGALDAALDDAWMKNTLSQML